jgi:hypothetical protein
MKTLPWAHHFPTMVEHVLITDYRLCSQYLHHTIIKTMKLISNTTPAALGKRRNKRLPSLKEAFSLQQKQRRSHQPAPLLETDIEDWVIPAEYQQYEDGPDDSNQYEEPAGELKDGGGDAGDFLVPTSWSAGQALTLATTTEQLSAYHDRLQQFQGLSKAEATTVSPRMSKLVL